MKENCNCKRSGNLDLSNNDLTFRESDVPSRVVLCDLNLASDLPKAYTFTGMFCSCLVFLSFVKIMFVHVEDH